MDRQVAGLIAVIVVGTAVALFPLYADALAPVLWSPGAGNSGEDYVVLTGVVERVDAEEGAMVVAGTVVYLKGWWAVRTGGGEERVWYKDLLGLIEPGMEVTVVAKETERWGLLAEEVATPLLTAYRG